MFLCWRWLGLAWLSLAVRLIGGLCWGDGMCALWERLVSFSLGGILAVLRELRVGGTGVLNVFCEN